MYIFINHIYFFLIIILNMDIFLIIGKIYNLKYNFNNNIIIHIDKKPSIYYNNIKNYIFININQFNELNKILKNKVFVNIINFNNKYSNTDKLFYFLYENNYLSNIHKYFEINLYHQNINKIYNDNKLKDIFEKYLLPKLITININDIIYTSNIKDENIITEFINLLNKNNKIIINNKNDFINFLHIDDMVNGLEFIFNKGIIGKYYNLGNDENKKISLLEFVILLIKKVKKTDNYIDWIDYDEKINYNYKYISNDEIKDLGWKINMNLNYGLELLINKKIDDDYLNNLQNFNENEIFGEWYKLDSESFKNLYINSEPFPNIIINNFLNEEYAEIIYKLFPENYEEWYKYNNPLEVKYANDKINDLPLEIKKLFYYLSTTKIINKIREITDINNLNYDSFLHGAGIHAHPRNGRLNLHLDYEKHPILDAQRRINIILYMSKDWKDEWNGQTELWNNDLSQCIVKSSVKFNTALIFQTNEISYHGLPKKILCPQNIYRKSIAYYYISSLENKPNLNKFGSDLDGYRKKASFIKKKNDEYDEKLDKFYNIRPYRLINDEDISIIWPEWNSEEF